MMLRTLTALLAVGTTMLVALPASAQIGFVLTTLDGPAGLRDDDEGRSRGFNSADCGAPSTATMRVDAPMGTTLASEFVDLWLSTDSTMCNDLAARDIMSGTCSYIGTADFDDTDGFFEVALSDLIAADSDVCADGSPRDGISITVYAFTTGNVEERGEVDATNYGLVGLNVDSTPPVAPEISADQAAVSGDSQVTLSWDRVQDDNPRYTLYPGGPCGDEASADLTDPLTTTDVGEESVSISPGDDLGLEFGESGSVFVSALDVANNTGELSEQICITRVAVAGFCDVYEEMGEQCPDGCSVAASMPWENSAWIGLAIGALFVRSRRQRGQRNAR